LTVLAATTFFNLIDEIVIEVSERNLGSDLRHRLLELLIEYGFEEFSRAGPAEHYDARYRRAVRAS
jgi:hypothetical protein